MKKVCIAIIKILGVFVLISIVSLMVILLAASIVNDHVAKETVKELEKIPLPDHTEYIESVNKAGKLVGCGNGMQYFGAILIKSELSMEELKAYYSNYAEKEWECVVENQIGTDINAVDDPFLSFETDAQGDNYYIVYTWGDNDTIFYDLDIRGH